MKKKNVLLVQIDKYILVERPNGDIVAYRDDKRHGAITDIEIVKLFIKELTTMRSAFRRMAHNYEQLLEKHKELLNQLGATDA
jgi:hypothetical protein